MSKKAKAPKPVDSADYKLDRFGILNAQGDFWTPDTFDNEEAARQHIRNFWRNQPDMMAQCLRTHRVVPVHVTVRLAGHSA